MAFSGGEAATTAMEPTAPGDRRAVNPVDENITDSIFEWGRDLECARPPARLRCDVGRGRVWARRRSRRAPGGRGGQRRPPAKKRAGAL